MPPYSSFTTTGPVLYGTTKREFGSRFNVSVIETLNYSVLCVVHVGSLRLSPPVVVLHKVSKKLLFSEHVALIVGT